MALNIPYSGVLFSYLADKSNIVKRTLIVFPLTTIIALGILTSRNKTSDLDLTSGRSEIAAKNTLLPVVPATASTTTAGIAVSEEEWTLFRNNAEAKIRSYSNLISENRFVLLSEKPEGYTKAVRKLDIIEAKLAFELSRLNAFNKSRVNWDVFESGFTREMDALSSDLKPLAAEKK